MHYQGLIIGIGTFIIIGIFHPIVVKAEYYFSKNIWPLFLILGLAFIGISLFAANITVAALLGALGFTCLWTIIELIEQEERVAKGWSPANPKRDYSKK